MTTNIQFKFINPSDVELKQKEFNNEKTLNDIFEFLIIFIENQNFGKFEKKDIELITTFPKKIYTIKDLNLNISIFSTKKIQIMVKMEKSLAEVKFLNSKIIPIEFTCRYFYNNQVFQKKYM
jgi:hypothetical protein